MAWLRKIKGKRGTRYHLVTEGKRSRSVGSSLKVAQRILDDYHAKSRLREAGIIDPVRCSWTLDQLKTADMADAERHGRDIQTRGYVWKAILAVLGAELRIDRIGRPEMERLAVATLLESKGATFNRRRALLLHALKLAKNMGIGFTFVDPGYPKLSESDLREASALTKAESSWLLGALAEIHPGTSRYVEVLLLTCSRRSEVRKSRIQADPARLLFPAHKRGIAREFRILGRLADLLEFGVPSWSRDSWEKASAKFEDKFGWRVRPHDLRHTGLTWAASQPGASLASLQKLGGWKSPAMVGTYLHSDSQAMSPVSP